MSTVARNRRRTRSVADATAIDRSSPTPRARSRWRFGGYPLTVGLILLLSPLVPARAATAAPSITASPSTALPRAAVTIRGSAFPKNTSGYIGFDGSSTGPKFRSNGAGSFSVSLTIPTSAAGGSHAIAANLPNGSSLATTVISVVVASPSPTAAPTSAPVPTATPAASASPTATPTPQAQVVLGAYLPGAPADPSGIDAYAALTGTVPRIVMWYQQWSGPYGAFDPKAADAVRSRGAMPLISWEPWAGSINDASWSLKTIIDGGHDAYIQQWTQAVAAWGNPIYVRPMYEMNGNWTSWSPGVNGNTAAQFVSAWRHIVDIARAQGATNIRWVWAPNVDDTNPNLTPFSAVYPGDAYVDWLGLDGYNWGSLASGNGWQSFTQVFETLGASYSQITALSPKPLMVSETASTELAGDKSAWITAAFSKEIPAMPRIRAVVWFDAVKETDWRVNSSSSSLASFTSVATTNAYAGVLP